MKKMNTLAAAFCTAALALAGGCAKDQCECKDKETAAVSGAANTKCPYSGGAVNTAYTSSYNGKTVAFCCGGCKGKWDSATTADHDAMMTKMASAK